jgi:hypothetical protein
MGPLERSSVYVSFIANYGGTFALAAHHALVRPGATPEDRFAISDCLLAIASVSPLDAAHIVLANVHQLKTQYASRLGDLRGHGDGDDVETQETQTQPQTQQSIGTETSAMLSTQVPELDQESDATQSDGGGLCRRDGSAGGLPRLGLSLAKGGATAGAEQTLLGRIVHLLGSDGDIALLEQLSDILKTIISDDDMYPREVVGLSTAGDQSFGAVFFDKYFRRLFAVYRKVAEMDKNRPIDSPKRDVVDTLVALTGQDASAVAASHRIICEVVTQCIVGHQHRMRYLFMQCNFLKYLFCVLGSKKCALHLGPLKVVRVILALHQEDYDKRLIKRQLIMPLVELMCVGTNGNLGPGGHRGNLVSSCAAELLGFVIEQGRKELVLHLVDDHSDVVTRAQLGGLGARLKERYDCIVAGRDPVDDILESGTHLRRNSSSHGRVGMSQDSTSVRVSPRAVSTDDENYFLDDDEDDGDHCEEKGNVWENHASMQAQWSGRRSALDSIGAYGDDDSDSDGYGGGGDGEASGESLALADVNSPPLAPLRSKFEDDDTEGFVTRLKAGPAGSPSSARGGEEDSSKDGGETKNANSGISFNLGGRKRPKLS